MPNRLTRNSACGSLYQEYIAYEKKLARIFAQNAQTPRTQFNERDYLLVEEVCDNVETVANVFSVIDGVLKNERLGAEYRFLVFGDFLFSIISYEMYS